MIQAGGHSRSPVQTRRSLHLDAKGADGSSLPLKKPRDPRPCRGKRQAIVDPRRAPPVRALGRSKTGRDAGRKRSRMARDPYSFAAGPIWRKPKRPPPPAGRPRGSGRAALKHPQMASKPVNSVLGLCDKSVQPKLASDQAQLRVWFYDIHYGPKPYFVYSRRNWFFLEVVTLPPLRRVFLFPTLNFAFPAAKLTATRVPGATARNRKTCP